MKDKVVKKVTDNLQLWSRRLAIRAASSAHAAHWLAGEVSGFVEGVHHRQHGLRYFFVAAMISSGRDLGMVPKLAGHSSAQVTADVYGSLFDGAAKDATEGVAALVRDALPRNPHAIGANGKGMR